MSTINFGIGDYGGYNNWAFSGSNSFWTNWANQTGTSGFGRVTSVDVRWDAYSPFCAGTNGTNDLWSTSSPFNIIYRSNSYSVGAVAGGTTESMHGATSGTDLWQGATAYYIGFSRTSTGCSIFGFANNAGSPAGYAGLSAGDGNINGGTGNWGGGNGALPCFGVYVPTQVYVRRSGVWQPAFIYVRRSGSWSQAIVSVYRSGVLQPANEYMNATQRHMPERGMQAWIDLGRGEGLERAWMVEEGTGWFGSVDPTRMKADWRKVGHYDVPDAELPFTGRLNSWEPEWVVDERLRDEDLRQRRLKSGDIEMVRRRVINLGDCGCSRLEDWERKAMLDRRAA